MTTSRRHLLAAGFALTPLAAALLSACKPRGNWPDGMKPIVWDRDICVRCSMVISDRRFAAEMTGGKDAVFKFDDIGCAMFWQRDKAKAHAWLADPATRIWVADVSSKGEEVSWLDARAARYVKRTSPMGYDFGARGQPQEESVDFQTMRERILASEK